jgi:hypothetical protein
METRKLEQESNHVTWFAVLSLSLLIIVEEIPFFHRIVGGYAIVIPFLLLFLFSIVKKRFILNRKDTVFLVCGLGYFAISFIYKFSGISSTGYGHDIHTVLYFCFFLALNTVFGMYRNQKLFILWTVVLSSIVVIVQNIIEYRRLGNYYFLIFRNESLLTNSNVIPTQYSAAIMLMSGVLLICILHDKSTTRKTVFFFLFVILNAFNLLVMQRTITLIFSILMYVFIFFFNTKRKAYLSLLLLIGSVVLIIVISNYKFVLSFVGNLIGSEQISERLNQIIRFFDSGDIMDAGGSLTARYRLYLTSLQTWVRSPQSFFFGVGDHISNNAIIGNHSQFFDVLGQYGIIGGIFLYYSVYRTLKDLLIRLSLVPKSPLFYQTLVIFFIFIGRGFVGYVVFEYVAVRLFVFMPILYSLFLEENKKTQPLSSLGNDTQKGLTN